MPPSKPSSDLPQSWKIVINFVQSVGVPVAFLAVIVYWMAFVLAPPILEGHTDFLKNSIATQERVADGVDDISTSMDDINTTMNEIRTIEQDSQVFMELVQKCHESQNETLDEIKTTVTKGL